MSSYNKVILVGRLGKDPELRQTQGGGSVVNFTMATSEKFTDKSGTKQEKTEWHRVVMWNKLADIAGKYLAKGSLVLVEGKLQTRSWEDQEGQKRYMTEVMANSMQMLGGGKRDSRDDGWDGRDSSGNNVGPQPAPEDDLPF